MGSLSYFSNGSNGWTDPANAGLGVRLLEQMQDCPDTTAFLDDDYSISYEGLRLKAQQLANELKKHHIALEEPIGILTSPGIDHVVAQIAVLFVGGTCVPLDPSLPSKELQIRLTDAETSYLITDIENQYRFSMFEQIVVSPERKPDDFFSGSHNGLAHTTIDHRTHMLYTSGTSGKPKAVQILARGIVRLMYSDFWSSVGAGDRVAHINNVSFDASIIDIWITLLCGATIVHVRKKTLLDPFAFSGYLNRRGITTMFITAALFNVIALACPCAFSGMKTLLVGGEVISTNACRLVLENGPPIRLFNVYGPTECTVFATAHEVTLLDVEAGPISLGKAIAQTDIYVLDESLGPVGPTEIGEVFIGGDGLSRGYFKRHELTNKAFVSVAGLSPNGAPRILYRTGDLVRYNISGAIDYVCRRDNQVKINGFRIELEAVEFGLIRTGFVSAAAALKIQPSQEAPAILVAYVVLTESKKEVSRDFLQRLRDYLPDYMLPRIKVIDKLPLNANGKLDRKDLTERYYSTQFERKRAYPESDSVDHQENTKSQLEKIWLEVLGHPVAKVSPLDSFFSLGGNSMQVAILIYQIKRLLKVNLSTQALYENPTLTAMATHIDDCKGGKAKVTDEKEIWLADARLAQGLESLAGELPNWRSATEGRVFMTGATGFVGAFFLAQLLDLPEVQSVGCLVRAGDSVSGMMRIRKNLIKYNLWQELFLSKILTLAGDLADPTLGLGPTRFQEIASWASVIFHLGAHVNYTQPYSTHRSSNVIGTLNILRLTVTGRPKPLHYVSSIAAFGPTGLVTGTQRLPEDEPLLPHLEALTYDTGYSQSQWVAEEMVRGTISRGFPTAIYRPGFVLGHSTTGISNRDDFVGRLMTSCITTRTYPVLPRQRKEFVPVDYVASALLHISSSSGNLHHAYNLIPPSSNNSNCTSIDLVDTFTLLDHCGQFGLRSLPYAEWVENVALDMLEKGSDDHPLKPLIPMLQE